MKPPLRSPVAGVLLAIAVAALVAFLGSGSEKPLEEHEVLVARTATEMQRTGDWIVPRFNGMPRIVKPPLSYWAVIAAHRATGGTADEQVDEHTARLPSALAALALILVTYWIAATVSGDRRAGTAAAAVWATSAGFFDYSHNARPEMLYALFCNVAVLGFLRLALGRGRPMANSLLAWGGVAFAVLAKGPLLPGLILLGLVVAVLVARRRDAECPTVLAVLRPWVGAVLVLGLSGIWFALVVQRVPGAIGIWRHELDRTDNGGGVGLGVLTLPYAWKPLPLLAPWLFLVPFAVLLVWRSRSLGVRLLAITLAVVVLLLGFARRSHDYYALPVLPLACVLMGSAAIELADRWRDTPRLSRVLQAHAVFAALAAAAIGLMATVEASLPVSVRPSTAAGVFGALGVVAACAGWTSARKAARSGVWIALSFALSFAAAAVATVGSERERFTKADFAKQVGQHVPATTSLARLSGSLELVAYYSDRRVDDLEDHALADWIAAHDEGVVLARRSELEQGVVNGSLLLEEQALPGRDPMVLIAPARR